MPQELQVLRCYSCHFFQVHIVKKSRKWECKMCGEKQSMKKVYGRGSGQDCRAHVQKLNKLAALQQESQIAAYGSIQQSDPSPDDDCQNIHGTASADFQNCRKLNPPVSSSSKWSVFLDQPENEDNEEVNRHKFSEPHKQNAGYSLKSSGRSMGNEAAVCNVKLTPFRNVKYCQNQDEHLNKALNSGANSHITTAETGNMQEDLLLKPSENKWFKYIQDKATNIQRESSIKQLSDHNLNPEREEASVCDQSIVFKSSSKWDEYIEEPTYDEGGNSLIKASTQLMKNNKICKFLTQSDDSVHCQKPSFPNAVMKATEKQMLSKMDITKNVTVTARGVNKHSSSNTFDRDYNEDELDNILDI